MCSGDARQCAEDAAGAAYEESAETRYLAAIVDDAPSALLTLDQEGRIEILNKAARQLFARYPLHRVEDLEGLARSCPPPFGFRRGRARSPG